MMATVFEPTTLAGIRMRNRLVRSATWEGMADPEGLVTEGLVLFYSALAAGEAGLIISSYLYIDRVGRQSIGQLSAASDDCIVGLSKIAQAVHETGGSIVGQIVHCGGQANREFNGSVQPVAPSSVDSPGYLEIPRALSDSEVEGVIDRFVAAAARLKSAGFDGVQLHGAHGYLLSQFLSPSRNLRSGSFGGSLEKRARVTLEVVRRIKAKVGVGFPVMIKMNCSDFHDGSMTNDDAVAFARLLSRAGIDAVEISGGTPGAGKKGAVRSDILGPQDEAYFRSLARPIRTAVPEVPLMLVGGLRSLEVIEDVLEKGEADYFSMSRPLIREPDLPRRWRMGDRRRAACESCLKCFGPTRRGEGVRCVQVEGGR